MDAEQITKYAEEEFNEVNNRLVSKNKWYNIIFRKGLNEWDKTMFITGYKLGCLRMLDKQHKLNKDVVEHIAGETNGN